MTRQKERDIEIRCNYCGVIDPTPHLPWCPWFESEDEKKANDIMEERH